MSLLGASSLSAVAGTVTVCRGLDLAMDAGEAWAVLGGNGAGKTTLLHTLGGLRTAAAGAITVRDRSLHDWRRRDLARELGVLFQDSSDVFPATVMETVLCGRYPHLDFWSFEGPRDLEICRAALAQVELSDMSGRQVDTLSGGERRRLAIATLLAQSPAIMLLDEPSNHLDLRHQVSLLSLLVDRARAEGGLVVMALHDVNLALRFCTHAVLMGNGETRQGPIEEVINEQNLEAIYHHPVRRLTDGASRHYFVPG